MSQDEGGTRDDDRAQFLTFRVGTEEFGLDILTVQEIRCWSGATPLPHAPPYVLGVINLRGAIVPVIDLRRRFDLPQPEYGPTTVVIVVRIDTATGPCVTGFVVDAVCEVYPVSAADRRSLPAGTGHHHECLQGLAMVDEKMIILLDVERLHATADGATWPAAA